MDSTLLKALLDSQERAYKAALDVVVQQLNDQISKLDSKANDLIRSLEFTQREVDDLKATIKDQVKEKTEDKIKIENLNDQLSSSNNKIKELEDRINQQEDYSRRNNIRISGMQEVDDGETWEQTAVRVTSLIEEKLQIPGIELERAHRVGKRRDEKPRPIVARFSRHCDREAVMRSARKLKGTNIYLNDDLCAASQVVKNAQMPLYKQARAQGKIAFFRHTKLIIKDRQQDAEGRRQSSAHAGGAGRGGMSSGRDGVRHEPAAAVGGADRAATVGSVAADGTAAAGDAVAADGGAAGGVAAADGGVAAAVVADGVAAAVAAAAATSGAAGGVVATEVAGVWSGKRDESYPSLSKPRRPPVVYASPQHTQITKKELRSSSKK